MDNFHRIINMPVTGGWSTDMEMRLQFLREQQTAKGKLYFLAHTSVAELNDFIPGKPYHIQLFDNVGIVHALSEEGPVAFNTHSLLENFTFLMATGEELAFLKQVEHVQEAFIRADRWTALSALPYASVRAGHQGFTPEWETIMGPHRYAEFNFCTKLLLDEVPSSFTMDRNANAMSKLTEMADLVRARQIEEDLEQRDPAVVTRLLVPTAHKET